MPYGPKRETALVLLYEKKLWRLVKQLENAINKPVTGLHFDKHAGRVLVTVKDGLPEVLLDMRA